MFSAYCKHCGTVVLLGPADVHSIHNTSAGIVLYFRCNQGHSGVWVTGRRSPTRSRVADGEPAATRGTDSPLRSRPDPAPRHGWLRAG